MHWSRKDISATFINSSLDRDQREHRYRGIGGWQVGSDLRDP